MSTNYNDPAFTNDPSYQDPRGLLGSHADAGVLILAGRNLRIEGTITATNLARFQNKVTFGDYSEDSDSTISSDIKSSFSGGFGNIKLKEGVDDDTFWTGSLETRRAGEITLLAKTWDYGPETGTAGVAVPIADYPATAPMFYVAFDQTLQRWNKTLNSGAGAFEEMGDLTALPVNEGYEWRSLLYIPLGTAGYATYNTVGDALVVYNEIPVVDFAYWDKYLVALTTDGKLRFCARDGAWEAEVDDSTDVQLPSGRVPRHLLIFRNQQGDRTLHIVTNRDVWAYDRDTPRIWLTDLNYPVHPQQGRGAVNWRGDSLYVSVGTGIHGYNGNTITAMGPDYRYGMPPGLRGMITSLTGEYNSMLALIQGEVPNVPDDGPPIQEQSAAYNEVPRPLPNADVRSCLVRWNQQGWHMAWVSKSPGGNPTWSQISEADDEYRLWWGFDGRMFTQKLPIDFHNPKVGMQIGTDEFEAEGEIVTGWFDADMPSYDKLLSHVELVLDDVFENGTPTGTVQVQYQTDYNLGSWVDMGTASNPGRWIFPFGQVQVEGGLFSEGVSCRRWRFRLLFAQPPGKTTYAPIFDNMITKFIKIPNQQLTWQFSVNLQRQFGLEGPQETEDFLNNLLSDLRFGTLTHRDRTYRVRVAGTTAQEALGPDHRASVGVNLVEVLIPKNDLRYPPEVNLDQVFEGA